MSDLREIADNVARWTELRRQHDHEHGQAYDAVERAIERLEMAGAAHEAEVVVLRAIRRRLNAHLLDGDCRAE